MQEHLINHPRLSVRRRMGSEGPAHDPYGYEEFRVDTQNGRTVLHIGLGVWLKHNGSTVERPPGLTHEEYEKWLEAECFEELTGYSLAQLLRIDRKLHERCRKCGGKHFTYESGYPGETLLVCKSCANIQGGWFNESAVM